MTIARRARRAMWAVPTEAHEMRMLAGWLDLAGVLWCHVPNGGKRHVATAKRLKREGTKAGVPDVLIFTPPPNARGYRGMAIELKRARGGTVSPEQEQWLSDLRECRWAALVATGASTAIKYLEEWGYSIGSRPAIDFSKIPF